MTTLERLELMQTRVKFPEHIEPEDINDMLREEAMERERQWWRNYESDEEEDEDDEI